MRPSVAVREPRYDAAMTWCTRCVIWLSVTAFALAQDPLPVVALPQKQGGRVSSMRSFSQGIAADGEARVWCLVYEWHPDDADHRELWLFRTDDHGKSWRRIAKVPTAWSVYGAIAGEPDSSILHVVWSTRVGKDNFSSAVYQRFDGEREKWLGEPEVLQRGSGMQDQFSIADLAVDRDGTLAALVATHRRPKRPPWPSGWSSGLLLRANPQAKWQGPYPVHTNTYGVWANLQLHDGRAHTTYRSSPSHSIIGYRSFSLAAKQFDQKKDVEISVRPKSGRYVSNASSLLVGPFGDRTVVYPAAASQREKKGQLLLAYSEDGEKWKTTVLADDPPMANGNVAHEHFALVRGPGRQAIALYSKVSEKHRVLYRRIVDGGRTMEAEREIARSDVDGAFKRIVAMRDGRLSTGVWAVVSGHDEAEKLGVRAVLAPRPMRTRWQ